MSYDRPAVSVVDDDPQECALTCQILESSREFTCRAFTSPVQFLKEFQAATVDCVVTDFRMPRIDGGELYRRVHQQDPALSAIIFTGHADVETAVRLMQQGVLTLLEKPQEPQALVEAVRRAVHHTQLLRAQYERGRAVAQQLEKLTDEERQVLDLMLAGLPNKTIAHRLSMSNRTLDRRRQHILQLMGATSVAELATMVQGARDRAPPGRPTMAPAPLLDSHQGVPRT